MPPRPTSVEVDCGFSFGRWLGSLCSSKPPTRRSRSHTRHSRSHARYSIPLDHVSALVDTSSSEDIPTLRRSRSTPPSHLYRVHSFTELQGYPNSSLQASTHRSTDRRDQRENSGSSRRSTSYYRPKSLRDSSSYRRSPSPTRRESPPELPPLPRPRAIVLSTDRLKRLSTDRQKRQTLPKGILKNPQSPARTHRGSTPSSKSDARQHMLGHRNVPRFIVAGAEHSTEGNGSVDEDPYEAEREKSRRVSNAPRSDRRRGGRK